VAIDLRGPLILRLVSIRRSTRIRLLSVGWSTRRVTCDIRSNGRRSCRGETHGYGVVRVSSGLGKVAVKRRAKGYLMTITDRNDEICDTPAIAVRDEHGRFLTGNSGGGRAKGSRNKLTEQFLYAIANDFYEHGTEAIAKVRTSDPAAYLKLVGSLIPRQAIIDREGSPHFDYQELTEEEFRQLIDRRKKQRYIEGVLNKID
jgi:hypothetical protein